MYFSSHEPNQPPHIHVDRDDQSAKLVGDGCTGYQPWLRSCRASPPNPGERVRDVRVTEDTLAVDLLDGRTIIVPLAWYPRLLNATMEQRSGWKVSGAGYGIHWPDIDEDLSTEGLLRGARLPPPSRLA